MTVFKWRRRGRDEGAPELRCIHMFCMLFLPCWVQGTERDDCAILVIKEKAGGYFTPTSSGKTLDIECALTFRGKWCTCVSEWESIVNLKHCVCG